MTNKRQLGRWFFGLLASLCAILCIIWCFDHKDGQAIVMAILTHAWVTAIKCLED